ncbi:hypothetical protein MCEMSEM29_00444 [Methylophilaceae bacterium]
MRYCISKIILLAYLSISFAFAEEDNLNSLIGNVIDGGVICPLIKTNEGKVFALVGILNNKFAINTKLELEGIYIKRSICQQGDIAFRIDRILKINDELQ